MTAAARTKPDAEVYALEHNLQCAIVQALRAAMRPGSLVMAIPNGGELAKGWRSWQRLRDEGALPGAPDLLILAPGGRVAFVEVKTAKGTLTDNQRAMSEYLLRNGFDYAVVRSVEAALQVAREWGLTRGAAIAKVLP